MPLFLTLVLVFLPSAAFAQQDNANGNGRKQAQAVRVPDGSIDLDGRLDEAAWREVPALTDFVQKEPVEGAPASRGERQQLFLFTPYRLAAGSLGGGGTPCAHLDRRHVQFPWTKGRQLLRHQDQLLVLTQLNRNA
jgi:hypothetical protein